MDAQKVTNEYRLNYWSNIIKECHDRVKKLLHGAKSTTLMLKNITIGKGKLI